MNDDKVSDAEKLQIGEHFAKVVGGDPADVADSLKQYEETCKHVEKLCEHLRLHDQRVFIGAVGVLVNRMNRHFMEQQGRQPDLMNMFIQDLSVYKYLQENVVASTVGALTYDGGKPQ